LDGPWKSERAPHQSLQIDDNSLDTGEGRRLKEVNLNTSAKQVYEEVGQRYNCSQVHFCPVHCWHIRATFTNYQRDFTSAREPTLIKTTQNTKD